MLLKRTYDVDAPKARWRPRLERGRPVKGADGQDVLVPPVNGVEVLRAGPRQRFSPDLVVRGAAEGWLELKGDRLVLRGTNVTLKYRVARTPGYYCCFDGAPMDDGPSAREYVAAKFPNKASPDPSNPAGYERINFYDCVKE